MLLRVLLATLVVAASLIPGLPQSSQPAQAFKVWVHEEILAAALDPGTMSDLAMGLILLGNATADIHQFADEMHFDNARSPREICDRWEAGLNAFMTEAVELSEPDSPGGQFLKDREGALQAYGRVTHAIADFYAHTNWIDTIAEYVPGMYPPTAPILSSVCDPDAFPPTLLSGFFDLRFGIDACPELGGEPAPPPGFLYCHEQLAKDERDAGHGAEIVPGMRVTYHEIAVSLSTDSTRASWSVLRDRVRARWGRDPEIDAAC